MDFVCHESLKVWLWDSVPGHLIVEVLHENYLSIFVLKLEVATSDGHDAVAHLVLDVVLHGGATNDPLNMIEHDPSILEITAWLHLPINQVNISAWTDF